MSQTSAEMSWNGAGTRYRPPRPGNSATVTSTASSTDSQPRDGRSGSRNNNNSPSRIPAWGRSPSTTPNYVTIGSIRYGVRFAAAATSPPREEAPPRGDAANQQHDCCCGVVQLLSPSRIPLPADKTPAINRRGIFSRINSGELSCEPAVYRTTVEWSQLRQDGLSMQQRSPQRELPRPSTCSPTRRRVSVRPKPDIPAYLKLCGSASSDSETSNLLTPSGSTTGSRDNLAEEDDAAPCNPRRNTLDRLHKFRFGGSGKKGPTGEGSSGRKKKPPRSSDKTESLRELTEKLKGDRRQRTEDVVDTPDATSAGGNHAPVKQMSGVDDLGVSNSAMDEEERTGGFKEDDIFECVNLRLPKPESRTIVGSYIQRTIPIRSASFSQVDFSPADGKYIRSSAKSSPFLGFSTSTAKGVLPLSSSSVIAGGSLTLPRKRLPDITTSASPSSSTTLGVDEPTGSTPSVDSAVGSDEGFVTSVTTKIPIVNKGNNSEPGGNSDTSHKPPGSRSLTYPLPRRGSRSDEDIPFSSIDGNGLKSLLYAPLPTGAGRELHEVVEESELVLTDSAMASKSCEVPCDGNHFLDSAVEPDLIAEEHESAEENVMDPALSSAAEHCVGDEYSAACQQLEHPVHFASHTIQNEADVRREENGAALIQNQDDEGKTITPDVQNQIDGGCLEEIPDSNSNCGTDLITEPVNDSVLSGLGNSEDNDSSECNPNTDRSVTVKCESGDGDNSCVFVTEWPTQDELCETENQHSSQLKTDGVVRNDDQIQCPESDEFVIICPEQNYSVHKSEALQPENGAFTKQVPEEEKVVHDEKDRNIEHSLNYAQETELTNPWQDQVENKEDADIQMEGRENKQSSCWPAQSWSGEGTDGDRTSNEWGSTQEESQSPDESTQSQWPKRRDGPRLVCQSSEEREEEPTTRPSLRRYQLLARTDSLSEGESDHGDRCHMTPIRDRTASPSFFAPSDLSDSEGRSGGGGSNVSCDSRSPHTPRRYSKRPLRGPYGQMLEAEMKKPDTNRIFSKLQYNEDLKFLEEYASPPPQRPSSPNVCNSDRSLAAVRPTSADNVRPRVLPTQSLDDSQLKGGYGRYSSSVTPTSDSRTSPKRKVSANIPYSAPNPITSTQDSGRGVFVYHHRTTSSPSQLEGYAASRHEGSPRPELLAELLRGSSEGLFVPTNVPLTPNGNSVHHWKDTRTHVVVELFETERSYVESLQILVMKYLKPLKSPENSGLVDAALVDEIFYQVPAILSHHEVFLEELQKRLDNWDIKQTVGDVFLEAFTKQPVIETYTSFINNWKTAKEAIKSTCQAKPAFARFLEAMAREHKGKLALDSLLIMPVQRIPRYELLIQTLLKHTDPSHPDHQVLLEAQKEVHDLAVKINCTERETLEYEQQQQTLKELEALIEGLMNLVSAERTFIRHDLVTMASGQGTRKERALFFFSDLLVITSIKRRSGTIRKPSTSCPGSVAGALEGNKYKLLMRIPLDDLEIVKAKDENLRRMLREMENLAEDVATLNQINDLTATLHCPHAQLEDLVREMLSTVNKQLADRQSSDSQLSCLELTLNTQSGIENISVVFTKPEKKTSWEESFNEAKQKLALSADRRPSPEFVSPLPIRKTRAGLQFTCAAPTLGLNAYNMRDVWVCNSDGYVGQVCVLSLQPEPTVISCNGVCNARILCVASIPVGVTGPVSSSSCVPGSFTNSKAGISISVEDTDEGGGNIQLDSSSSSEDDDEADDINSGTGHGDDVQKRIRSASDSVMTDTTLLSEDTDGLQPTMWLGTEDGCIHVYNCSDNIRIKKNKVKIQHGSSVHCIIYLDNRVFVSLANGDITVYIRDHNGGWNTTDPYTVSVGTAAMPVTRMLPITGKLWCGCHNAIKILSTSSLEVEHSFQVNSDSSRAVTCMAMSGFGVWVSLQNSAVIRLFHATTYECLCDVNVAPAVTKMLASCDDIIRQHKAACLRVTSLLACKDLLWIGTSAGVVLTMPLPHISPSTTKLSNTPNATGVPHGHTGHVRFLTFVETSPSGSGDTLMVRPSTHHRYSLKSKPDLLSHQTTTSTNARLLVISGGDGYEDFRTSSVSEVAGREDSTNHLLLWHV